MVNFKLSFETEEDDLLLFQAIDYYLVNCFKYSESDSIELIEKYNIHRQKIGPVDWTEWMHHDGPFVMACHIQHTLLISVKTLECITESRTFYVSLNHGER